MIKIIKKRNIIIGIVIALAVASFFFFRNGNGDYNYETVEERELVKEVFESGAVKTGEDINLSFQIGGGLDNLHVEEGEKIEKGQILASLSKTDLLLQKKQAESQLETAIANLEMTLTGARPEEINSMEERLKEAKTSLELAEKSLREAEEGRETALETAYSGIPSLVNGSYLLSKELKDTYKNLRDKYFSGLYLQDTYLARDKVEEIENNYEKLRDISRSLTVDSSYEDIDKGLTQTQQSFSVIVEAIEVIIDISDTDFYDRRFSIEDDQTLWSTKSEASDMLSKITSAISELKSTKNSTKASVTSAQSSLNNAQSRKNEIEDNLEISQKAGRDEQVKTSVANLQSAQAGLALAENNLQKATLKTPTGGVVKKINYKEGESVTPNSPVVTITPDTDFYVKLNIYEGDIAKVSIGDKADISFIAFDDTVTGEVISKDTTGQLIDGVVYFEIKVAINNSPEGLLNEMTGDVSVIVESKTTLSVPRQAIIDEDGKTFVQLMKDGEKTKKEIEAGLTDSYGYVEIVDGLEKGDKVIIN